MPSARAYAERHYGPGRWLILSARHGLVEPDTVLDPYDLSLRQLTAQERQAWGNRIAVELNNRFPASTVLWFHTGALYRDAIAPVVAHEVRCPLAGLGIGDSDPGPRSLCRGAAHHGGDLDGEIAELASLYARLVSAELDQAAAPRVYPRTASSRLSRSSGCQPSSPT